MERIAKADIIAASREIPGRKRPELVAYLNKHLDRLEDVNPHLGELIKLIAKRAGGAHHEVVHRTPEEMSEYVGSLLLLLIRTIEVAESRVATEGDEITDTSPLDPNTLTKELFAKLSGRKRK